MPAPATRVVLDWGTSSFRAFLIGPDDRIIARIESPDGISTLSRDDYPRVLAAALAEWRATHGDLAIVAAGMIGSRNGWVELPYADCPAGEADLAALARAVPVENGLTITFLPGLTDRAAHPFPDVMRGEETQLVGLGLARDRTVVLPGTHSKWATITGGRISRFQTVLTGELFAVVSQHAFIARMAAPPEATDLAAFDRGVDAARDGRGRTAGLLQKLFSVRAGWLSGGLAPAEMRDYLSGLVIGSEFAEAQASGWFPPDGALTLIGAPALVAVYTRAAAAFGLDAEAAPADIAVTGALRIARAVSGFPQG